MNGVLTSKHESFFVCWLSRRLAMKWKLWSPVDQTGSQKFTNLAIESVRIDPIQPDAGFLKWGVTPKRTAHKGKALNVERGYPHLWKPPDDLQITCFAEPQVVPLFACEMSVLYCST